MQVSDAFFTRTVGLCKMAGLVNREATFVGSRPSSRKSRAACGDPDGGA
jgi:hypothetical protein